MNEKISSDVFIQFAEEFKINDETKDFVSKCIIDTITHKPHIDNSTVKAFLDCDLSILARDDTQYRKYAKDI